VHRRSRPAVLAAAYDGAVVVDRHGFDGFALVVGQDPCDLSPPRQMAGLRPRLFGDAKDADLAGGCRDCALSAAEEDVSFGAGCLPLSRLSGGQNIQR